MSGRLVRPDDLPAVYDKLNDWSKSIVQKFWPDLPVGAETPILSD